ncbi:MAG: hypothetical protein HOQ18_13415, partial [Dermatophilaceae bacterium]|nr:hypothetical protein [Dermatophilaceae bacterium]
MDRRVAAAGLVAFLAIDIALVVLALRSGREAPAASPLVSTALTSTATTLPTPTTSAPTGASATSTTTASTTPATQPSAAAAEPVARLVSALDATTAWRATVGSCAAGRARVEVSTDGGATWTRLRSPARAVARVQP